MIDENGRVSWKLFVSALSFFFVVGGGLGTILAKDIAKNEERIDKIIECQRNIEKSAVRVEEQVRTIQAEQETSNEMIEEMFRLILIRLNESDDTH